MKLVNAAGGQLLVVNDGAFRCLDAKCTHAGGALAQGTLEGGILTCPRHQSQFRVSDGYVVRGPARKALGTYSLLEKDGDLFVKAGATR